MDRSKRTKRMHGVDGADLIAEHAARWTAYHDRGKAYRNPDPAGRAEEFLALLLRNLEVLRSTGREPRRLREVLHCQPEMDTAALLGRLEDIFGPDDERVDWFRRMITPAGPGSAPSPRRP